MINSSEACNLSMARLTAAREEGDTLNATIAAADMQIYSDAMNRSSQELIANASALSRLLQNTSGEAGQIDWGIDRLNDFLGQIDVFNRQPESLPGRTSLTLDASKLVVSPGDTVMFTVCLSSNDTGIGQGMISLAIDDTLVDSATTGDDGRCAFNYVIGRDTFGRAIDAIAYYDPHGGEYPRAVSNVVELTRRGVTAGPDRRHNVGLRPGSGTLVHVHGQLTADGSFPVPDRPITVSLSGCPDCRVTTSDDGSYDCDLVVSPGSGRPGRHRLPLRCRRRARATR